jgi:hypothetical protein
MTEDAYLFEALDVDEVDIDRSFSNCDTGSEPLYANHSGGRWNAAHWQQ